jgi:hypothetical protein
MRNFENTVVKFNVILINTFQTNKKRNYEQICWTVNLCINWVSWPYRSEDDLQALKCKRKMITALTLRPFQARTTSGGTWEVEPLRDLKIEIFLFQTHRSAATAHRPFRSSQIYIKIVATKFECIIIILYSISPVSSSTHLSTFVIH